MNIEAHFCKIWNLLQYSRTVHDQYWTWFERLFCQLTWLSRTCLTVVGIRVYSVNIAPPRHSWLSPLWPELATADNAAAAAYAAYYSQQSSIISINIQRSVPSLKNHDFSRVMKACTTLDMTKNQSRSSSVSSLPSYGGALTPVSLLHQLILRLRLLSPTVQWPTVKRNLSKCFRDGGQLEGEVGKPLQRPPGSNSFTK